MFLKWESELKIKAINSKCELLYNKTCVTSLLAKFFILSHSEFWMTILSQQLQ